MNTDIAQKIMALDEKVRSGSLCIYGCWFGRPMDNYHISTGASFDGEVLEILFNRYETLEIWNPSEVVVDGIVLRIPKATKIKWSWYYYGKPRSPETLMYHEYVLTKDSVISNTSDNPDIKKAAVELC